MSPLSSRYTYPWRYPMSHPIVRTVKSLSIALLLFGALLGLTRSVTHAAATNPLAFEETPVTVVMWHSYEAGVQKQGIDLLIAEFNATDPYNIEVQGIYAGRYGEISDQVISALRKGEMPPADLVHAYSNSVADFARYDAVRYLDDYAADATVGILYPEDSLKACSIPIGWVNMAIS